MEDLSKNNPLQILPVKNLDVYHVMALIADTLGYSENEKDPAKLTDLIYEKTSGNPFFTIRLLQNLYEEKVLQFDYKKSRWIWDPQGLSKLEYSDNVIDLLVKKLNTFPGHVIETIKFASCIGNRFDLETLSVISEKEKALLESNLDTAVLEKLIYPVKDEVYQFIHDRVQQAAYSLVRPEHRKALHLKIGRLLSNSLS